ncbi:hypothetical protein ACU686_27350 [Yinghuangia aomiensis]
MQAAVAAAEELGPLRACVDTHGGPASGGRLVGKDGTPSTSPDSAPPSTST